MTKTRRGFTLASWHDLKLVVSRADVVLEVLDARDPMSTRSKRLEQMVENMGRELILVLNKSDLVPREIVEAWTRLLRDRGYRAVYIAARDHKGTRVLRRTIKEVAPAFPVIVAVTGYPKTGKSTIINALKGKHSASTSPIPGSPGYTRHVQLYRIDSKILMIDTPGVIPVEGGPLERIIRGMSPEQLDDPVKPAMMLIEKILKHNPYAIRSAYGIAETDPLKILEKIAIKRGWFYKKTKEPLIEEAARTIIRDYHRGKIPFYVKPEDYF
ncbi:50S ribosome-binding GTPase [Desulfurococcaceae archaeon MEX13E-LK6-19]|nr:50S ribosome-binding GTPase [Desulfurococcaceae archaeon MEX13E-LK6-19]